MSKEQSKALFYTQGVEEVLKSLDTSIDGLSTAQAKERLDAYGYNELDEGEKRSLLSRFDDHHLACRCCPFYHYRRQAWFDGCLYYFCRCCFECSLWCLSRGASRSGY